MQGVRIARLDPLGIVVGICRKIGLAEHLDGLAEPIQQQVSVGTATVAMVLNGLMLSNRGLCLVLQFFASKPDGAATGSRLRDRATVFPMQRWCDGTVSQTATDVKQL
jgi:hypothetical protein